MILRLPRDLESRLTRIAHQIGELRDLHDGTLEAVRETMRLRVMLASTERELEAVLADSAKSPTASDLQQKARDHESRD